MDEVGVIAAVDKDKLAEARGGLIMLEDEKEPLSPGRVIIRVDERYFRPTEVVSLLGDASKAKRVLGWEPTVSFAQLTSEMVQADLAEARRELL
jgi:GDPmannose 4,6-dehydratase